MKDVAEKARVSVSTVSHVLNGTRRVADGTQEAVLAAVEELSYQPNLLAKSLKTRRTFTIGLLVSDIQNSFFTSVVRGIEDLALSRGYHLFLCNTDEDAAREDEYVRELAKKRVDGLLVASSAPRHNHARRLRAEGLPFVFVDRKVEGVAADVISVDNREGMRLISYHLAGLGHERIGMISGPLDKASGYERYLGLRAALADLGVSLEDSLVRFGNFRTSSGREGARELLRLPSPPTALVTANNQMTLGALMAVKEMGLRIPDDVSVVGFDDPEWAPLTAPPLTTLAQPTYEMGVEAARLLLDRIEGEQDGRTRRVLLEPWLVVRGSTAPPGRKAEEETTR
ncbi:MAG: LacI family transcriptional regulator [Actinomycetota bacterium]|nr:LacI family transcriptional regulator [Actinomycetota bacterium]